MACSLKRPTIWPGASQKWVSVNSLKAEQAHYRSAHAQRAADFLHSFQVSSQKKEGVAA
jgi:hypothetical protein